MGCPASGSGGRLRLALALSAACCWGVPQALAIAPGQTRSYTVWEGNTDRLTSSKNGLRTFTVWVPDDQTVVDCRWLEEIRGGYKWVVRHQARVRGAGRRHSCTVYLRPTENFRLEVKGVHSSMGKRKICRYTVQCSDDPVRRVATFGSRDLRNLDTWWKAGPYQRWYWGGCACWVLVNPVDREILLFDGYVSKGTVGGAHDYDIGKDDRKKVLRLVNLLRHLVAGGYRVVGILTSHKHGDHVGDLPYLLAGLRARADGDFMKTGGALSGRCQTARIPVVASADTIQDPYYADPKYDRNYARPARADFIVPAFPSGPAINDRPFAQGRPITLGRFLVDPYIWDHGKIADGAPGAHGPIRTLAYRVQRLGGARRAITFFTSGYIEDDVFLKTVNRPIPCHHVIGAWNGHRHTAAALGRVQLLPDSPVGVSYLFTNHCDRNSNASYGADKARDEAVDMLGQLMEEGIVGPDFDFDTGRGRWRKQPRTLRLGLFLNRVGVDG